MWRSAIALLIVLFPASELPADAVGVSYGPRPGYLIDKLEDGPLKTRLRACEGQTARATSFSIGHRGAPLQFPEHTRASYRAAARMGAGILECDVTFTQDLQLVCRHAQNDLHRTTDILVTDLARSCATPFEPATATRPARAECRTSDVTLAELRQLRAKMDSADAGAQDVQTFLGGGAAFRTELYASGAQIMTHAETIALFRELGVKFMPELKRPVVDMPFRGMLQSDYAQKLVDAYKAAGVPPEDVWLQSFNLNDILYWIENEPEFGAQAVYLDDSYRVAGFDPGDPATYPESLQSLRARGVRYIAPPLWVLVTSRDGAIVPSAYALEARAAGLNILTWTLERSGSLENGGGWYFQSIADATDHDGVYFELLHVLAQDVGVAGVFSDWPATVTYYANCFGL